MTIPTNHPQPLRGIRVIDFSTIVAGPWCTRLLADCGAEVIKVEPVEQGDLLRFLPPIADGTGAAYAHYNCGKRAVALNLKTKEGAELARKLVLGADVVVENFRPGVMARMGLGYADLAAEHPRLIYCSVSGFGQQGERAGDAAYAPVVHALSGFDITMLRAQQQGRLDAEGAPPSNSIVIADVVSAIYAFGAVQTALYQRERHGYGTHIDLTLIESMMSLLGIQYQEAQSPTPVRPTIFRPTPTRDGYIIVPIVSWRNYLVLYPVIGHADWVTDERFSSVQGAMKNKLEIEAALDDWARELPSAEVLATLSKAGLAAAPYQAPGVMLDDPHMIAHGSYTQMPTGYRVLNAPFQFSAAPITPTPWVAKHGEHTREVLEETLGLSAEELSRLEGLGAFR